MEGSTFTRTDAERGEDERDDDEGRLPEAVVAAADGRVTEPGHQEVDATSWLLESDVPTSSETAATEIRLNVGTPAAPKEIIWKVVPLPDKEFRRFRNMVLGNRRARRAVAQGDPTQVDDWRYHALVVAAATVDPDLKAVAEAKGVDEVAVLMSRFAAKPGLINQISGIVSDISGMDEADAEVVAGNF